MRESRKKFTQLYTNVRNRLNSMKKDSVKKYVNGEAHENNNTVQI